MDVDLRAPPTSRPRRRRRTQPRPEQRLVDQGVAIGGFGLGPRYGRQRRGGVEYSGQIELGLGLACVAAVDPWGSPHALDRLLKFLAPGLVSGAGLAVSIPTKIFATPT